MNKLFKKKTSPLTAIIAMAVITLVCCADANAERTKIDRYKVDFTYQGIEYTILSESEKTVAVSQSFDIDFAGGPALSKKAPYHLGEVGPNGFLMGYGLEGTVVAIPSTVYDAQGNEYTVTDLADYAIDWVGIGTLILPPTLERLNNGICDVFGLHQIYLPEGIKAIEGISYCSHLKTLHVPYNVESIGDQSLYECGFEDIYLPPSVKTLGKEVLANCDSLRLAMISGVETMGASCFSDCESFLWANLPETLKSMGEGCFNDCPSLDLVSLPWSEIKMDACFNGCPNISRIEVLAIEPNPFPEGSFLDVDRTTCTLAVPEGSEDKYREAEGWKDFLNIVGDVPAITPSAVATVPSADFRAFGSKGTLHIINPTDTPIEVYAVNGEKVASLSKSGQTELPLTPGVYIVSSPFASRKVAIN